MTKFNHFISILISAVFLLSACSGNPCDDVNLPPGFSCDEDSGDVTCNTTCDPGEVLLVTCICAVDANSITPDPCANTPDCAEGQVKAYPGCNCVDLMSDPCEGVTCPEGFICSAGACIPDPNAAQTIDIIGQITQDMTWTSGNTYILNDRVTVVSGVTLNIEPGVVVKGQAGTGANASALLIARGATINATGTADAPIIFTSIADRIEPGQINSPNLDPNINGLWGGLIVLGNAPISASNDAGDIAEVQIEGIPTSDQNGLYGGNDADDSSGILTYISIRHGGSNIGEGNEINGLTLGGVGAGTTINHVEVVANQDDGIEWFGGTVSASNIVIWNSSDDGLDTDQAWNGTCDNWVVVTPFGGSAMELDGPEGSLTQGPNNFINGTIYAGGDIDHLIDWDGNTNTGVSNVYFTGIDAGYDASVAIESFGGDGTGTTDSWEYTVPAGYDAATAFADAIAAGEATEVAAGANTVGANTSVFGWTWAVNSGAFSAIGL